MLNRIYIILIKATYDNNNDIGKKQLNSINVFVRLNKAFKLFINILKQSIKCSEVSYKCL